MRLTKDMKSSATNDKLSAGTCGTVKAHCREGIYIDEDYITIVLRVKWGEDVLGSSESQDDNLFFKSKLRN